MVVRPQQRAFILAVREKLGLTQTALGEALGQANGYGMAHAWETEKSILKYPEMYAMLEMCGWIPAAAEKALTKAQLAVAAQAVDRAVADAPRPKRRPPDSQERRASRR